MNNNTIITKIELQDPRNKSYALYSEDVFLVEITEDTLVHFAISRGSEFSKKEFETIIDHDKVNLCLRQSYNYLQRRPHLQKELERKLKQKGFPLHIIERAFLHLRKNKYINDDDFICMFIRDILRQGKSGPLLIKKKLAEKGALFNKIDLHLDELFPIEKQKEIALRLLNGKHSKLNEQNKMKHKQKLLQYGMGRGFSWVVLEPIINRLVSDEDY